MRPALQNLLYERYPDLFQEKDLPMTETCMCWGFDHNDGWFAIVDALSEVITDIDPTAQARQVKEKFASLRFYCQTKRLDIYDAIHAAGNFSTRICEDSGAIGRVVVTGGWLKTMSAEKIARLNSQKGSAHTKPQPESIASANEEFEGKYRLTLEERLHLTLDSAIENLQRRYPASFTNTRKMQFPPHFYDLIDTAVCIICDPLSRQHIPAPIKIEQISWSRQDGLSIHPSFLSIRRYALAAVARETQAISSPVEGSSKGDDANTIKRDTSQDKISFNDRVTQITNDLTQRVTAITSFVKAMSLRMDPNTGHCGPVDDQGRLILPENSPPDPPDLLDNMHQARELLHGFDSQQPLRPHVFCKNMIKPSLEARERIAQSIRTGFTQIIMPHIYSRPVRNFPISTYDPVPYQIAIALAEQHGWHIALPVQLGQFFMGRRARPKIWLIDHFIYDQATKRHFDVKCPFTLEPALDNRIFSLNAPSQVILQHIQIHPDATDEELLADARFAAASWIGESTIKKSIARDLNAGRFQRREAVLAHSILRAVQTQPRVLDHAPPEFDPAAHEADAARIYSWSIEENHLGNLYLRADRIENHPEIQDYRSLRYSTALVWYDLNIGWARTRSRYYRLMGDEHE